VRRLTASTKFAEAAELWRVRLVQLKAGGVRKGSTVDVYRAKLDNLVLPALRGYRLGELTGPILNVVLADIAVQHGVQTACGCRSVNDNVLEYAVSRGHPVQSPPRRPPVAARCPRPTWCGRAERDLRPGPAVARGSGFPECAGRVPVSDERPSRLPQGAG
jgi:hypothetical protein